MSINRTKQTLEDRPITDIEQLKRDVREIKNIQPIGSDILRVVDAPDGVAPLLAGPISLSAGSSGTFVITVTPANETLTLWNFAFTPYVDVYDDVHQFPAGTSLVAGDRELYVFSWLDWADSSDVTNARVFKIRLKNADTNTHNYYIAFKAYLPQGITT